MPALSALIATRAARRDHSSTAGPSDLRHQRQGRVRPCERAAWYSGALAAHRVLGAAHRERRAGRARREQRQVLRRCRRRARAAGCLSGSAEMRGRRRRVVRWRHATALGSAEAGRVAIVARYAGSLRLEVAFAEHQVRRAAPRPPASAAAAPTAARARRTRSRSRNYGSGRSSRIRGSRTSGTSFRLRARWSGDGRGAAGAVSASASASSSLWMRARMSSASRRAGDRRPARDRTRPGHRADWPLFEEMPARAQVRFGHRWHRQRSR